ncbi:Heparinase II/III-like protein [Spirosomataceae bacterium TFI 002]|nr:Heparinase II/III-like protein [Spirosomataceae bacterium TFI 002]
MKTNSQNKKLIMKKVLFGLIVILMATPLKSISQMQWKEIKTSNDLVLSYPKELEKTLLLLDLNKAGLEKVKLQYQSGNLGNACDELLAYYKNNGKVDYLRKPVPKVTNQIVAEADTTLKNVFFVQNVRGEVKYGKDGHRDWYFKGPNNDREWAWLSNRHTQLLGVYEAYLETGNPEYAIYIDEFLRDFIIKSMPYPAQKGGESIWRGLEVAARVKVWTKIFYGLQDCEYFSPATRLLMLTSLPDHAHYNRQFHSQNNWLTMEITALATFATHFDEFKTADEWLAYSIETMVESMKGQIYPDGVQTELTSHYHNVSLLNFELLKTICDRLNKPLPDFYNKTIEQCYSYISHAVRPDGFRALNNDGDRGSDKALILKGAEIYNQPTWKYIVTNGQEGVKPSDGPSYFYPWAGHLFSRSDFSEKAHWSIFDVGPWGSGHQHNDKLHLSISAFGKDFLVDAGRFAYTGETADKFRPYAKGSQGHNLVLIDHKGQAPGPKLATEPLSNQYFKISPEFDYASQSMSDFGGIKGEVSHTRSLLYVRGEFWVVADRIKTTKPREIETLWHWHPQCSVEKDGSQVFGKNENGNLTILPVGNTDFDISFIKGQEKPEIQGWYSESYNIFEPNITSQYATKINGDKNFVWLIFPSQDRKENVRAELLSSTNNEVKLKVISDSETWFLTIPFENSEKVKVKKN